MIHVETVDLESRGIVLHDDCVGMEIARPVAILATIRVDATLALNKRKLIPWALQSK